MLSTMDQYAAQRLDPGESSMRIGIFRAEPWTNSMRERIESVFGIHAVHIYGLSEIVGPRAANECVETKDGPQIWEDRFCPEVIGPRTSEALPDGEAGVGFRRSFERSHAGSALSNARFNASSAGNGAGNAPNGKSDGKVGRHQNTQRRQLLPVANRKDNFVGWRPCSAYSVETGCIESAS